MSEPYGIHWFRRDLRLVGNPALTRNLLLHPGRVLGVFCFDREILARPDFSANRFFFFLRTLETLRAELRARDGDLLFLDGEPRASLPRLLEALRRTKGYGLPRALSWNRDYEPFARARDLAVKRAAQLSSYDRETAERRLAGYLARRGYSGSTVRAAVQHALASRHATSGVRFR